MKNLPVVVTKGACSQEDLVRGRVLIEGQAKPQDGVGEAQGDVLPEREGSKCCCSKELGTGEAREHGRLAFLAQRLFQSSNPHVRVFD